MPSRLAKSTDKGTFNETKLTSRVMKSIEHKRKRHLSHEKITKKTSDLHLIDPNNPYENIIL